MITRFIVIHALTVALAIVGAVYYPKTMLMLMRASDTAVHAVAGFEQSGRVEFAAKMFNIEKHLVMVAISLVLLIIYEILFARRSR